MTRDKRLNIREAGPDDLALLADLWHERLMILGQADPRFRRWDYDRAAWIERTSDRLGGADFVVFVAMDGGPVGYIVGELRQGEDQILGIVREMALDAHRYHAGLGRGLWAVLRDWFTQAGAARIVVQVPRYHPVEQAFWRSAGAVEWSDATTIQAAGEIPPELMWMTL